MVDYTSCPPIQTVSEDLAVKHRLSSATNPQFNGWVELTIKLAKRSVNGNTGAQGSLDNDRTARAILQYRNMPIHYIRLSPTQLLLHLHDFIPSQLTLYKSHTHCIAAAQNCEMSLSQIQLILLHNWVLVRKWFSLTVFPWWNWPSALLFQHLYNKKRLGICLPNWVLTPVYQTQHLDISEIWHERAFTISLYLLPLSFLISLYLILQIN